MAKVCKFCSHDNDETLEFCDKCGAKLPVFHQLIVVDERKKQKKHIKINFAAVLGVILLISLLFCSYMAFFTAMPADELPEYAKGIKGTKLITSALRNIPDNAKRFNVSLYVIPESISIYLSSLAKPTILEKEEYDENVIPRLLINFPENRKKEYSLIYRDKFCGLNVRYEFIFKQHENENKWFLDSCYLGKLAVPWYKEEIFNDIMEDYFRHPDMNKIRKAQIDIKPSKRYVNLGLKYEEKQQDKMIQKVEGFISNIIGKAKDATSSQSARAKELE